MLSHWDSVALVLLAFSIACFQVIRGNHYHQSSPPRPAKPDPIDPSGRGNPGIVIVYKKAEEPQTSSQNNYYRPQSNSHYNDYHHHGPPKSPHYGNLKRKPPCADLEESYCLYDHGYPMDKVSKVAQHYRPHLSSLYNQINHYSMNDFIVHDNATHKYRHKGHFVCESDVSYVRPGWAKNWKGEWVAVLNTDVFPQSVRIEVCKYPKKKCEYMPPCYKSYCVQRYTYVKLICVDPYDMSKKPTVDVFEVPSACSCFVENFSLYK